MELRFSFRFIPVFFAMFLFSTFCGKACLILFGFSLFILFPLVALWMFCYTGIIPSLVLTYFCLQSDSVLFCAKTKCYFYRFLLLKIAVVNATVSAASIFGCSISSSVDKNNTLYITRLYAHPFMMMHIIECSTIRAITKDDKTIHKEFRSLKA